MKILYFALIFLISCSDHKPNEPITVAPLNQDSLMLERELDSILVKNSDDTIVLSEASTKEFIKQNRANVNGILDTAIARELLKWNQQRAKASIKKGKAVE